MMQKMSNLQNQNTKNQCEIRSTGVQRVCRLAFLWFSLKDLPSSFVQARVHLHPKLENPLGKKSWVKIGKGLERQGEKEIKGKNITRELLKAITEGRRYMNDVGVIIAATLEAMVACSRFRLLKISNYINTRGGCRSYQIYSRRSIWWASKGGDMDNGGGRMSFPCISMVLWGQWESRIWNGFFLV